MNAIQFIKEHGVDKAREVVEGAPEWASEFCFESNEYINYSDTGSVSDCNLCVPIERLKTLVESVDLIKFYDDIEKARFLLEMSNRPSFRPPHVREVQLKQAIADYESIYGGEYV